MSLHDFSISESRDAEFFKHVFALKKSDSNVHETIPLHDNVPLSASSSRVRISFDEPKGVRELELRLVLVLTSSLIF